MNKPRQAFSYPGHHGKWIVHYDDGHKSNCMNKSGAKDYAEMFGGTVHRHPYYPTISQRFWKWWNKRDESV